MVQIQFLYRRFFLQKFLFPPHISFRTLQSSFLPWNKYFGMRLLNFFALEKTSECVFQIFSNFELEKFEKSVLKFYTKTKMKKWGRKETRGWKEKTSILFKTNRPNMAQNKMKN
jgi:hypothetical protein